MQLAAFNLNHLVALDALLRERHVGRAASRLGITQSALSHTLRTLRQTMGDPLLVRVGNDMVLTPYAEQAQLQLQQGLGKLQAVVSGRAAFDPATITDTFTLATLDGVAASIARPLVEDLRARAPGAALRIVALDNRALHRQLETGEVDVVAVPPFLDLTGLESTPMRSRSSSFREMSVVCRRDHPDVGARLTLARYCKIPHVVVGVTGEGPTFIDHALAAQGRSREIKVRVSYLLALAEVVAGSDYLATTVTAMADFLCERWPLRKLDLPLKLGELMPMLLCWHPRFTADPAHRFFREVVGEAAERSTLSDDPATPH